MNILYHIPRNFASVFLQNAEMNAILFLGGQNAASRTECRILPKRVFFSGVTMHKKEFVKKQFNV